MAGHAFVGREPGDDGKCARQGCRFWVRDKTNVAAQLYKTAVEQYLAIANAPLVLKTESSVIPDLPEALRDNQLFVIVSCQRPNHIHTARG